MERVHGMWTDQVEDSSPGGDIVANRSGADFDDFWTTVRRLPARQAQSAALRYIYELDIAEIAWTLEISEGSVKQHLSRARARLAQDLHLTEDPVEEVER